MRLDKFLKISRLIKRRTLAKEVAEQGRITVNDQPAKASTSIVPGDILGIQFGQKLVTVRVNDTREVVKKDEAAMLYDVIKEERTEK